MCGRYIIRQQAKALREWEKYGPPPFLESYNVAPTQEVPIVRMRDQNSEFASIVTVRNRHRSYQFITQSDATRF